MGFGSGTSQAPVIKPIGASCASVVIPARTPGTCGWMCCQISCSLLFSPHRRLSGTHTNLCSLVSITAGAVHTTGQP